MELLLEPLVSVDAQLSGVREVGAELEKEQAEVAVDAVAYEARFEAKRLKSLESSPKHLGFALVPAGEAA